MVPELLLNTSLHDTRTLNCKLRGNMRSHSLKRRILFQAPWLPCHGPRHPGVTARAGGWLQGQVEMVANVQAEDTEEEVSRAGWRGGVS